MRARPAARSLLALALAAAVLAGAAGQAALPLQPASAEAQPVAPQRTYRMTEPGGGDGSPLEAVLAPNTAVRSPQLDPPVLITTDSAEACSAACRANLDCDWMHWCGVPAGCDNGVNGTLEFRQCNLLGEGCLIPAVGRAAPSSVTSGFPLRPSPTPVPTIYSEFAGVGINAGEGDYECPASVVPGMCAFNNTGEAMLTCYVQRADKGCKSVVVYLGGLDGCSKSPLSVLKSVTISPENSWISPHVSTMVLQTQFAHPIPFFLYSTHPGLKVVPPTPQQLAAGRGSLAADGSGQAGCVVAPNALLAGVRVETLDGVASAEACCAACQQRGWGPGGNGFLPTGDLFFPDQAAPKGCNAYNYCGQDGGCSWNGTTLDTGMPINASLAKGQCELRWQEMASVPQGLPVFVSAKGSDVPFTAGCPLSHWPAEQPGFEVARGRGLFTHGSYNCSNSFRDWDCAKVGTQEQLAQECLDDPRCAAMSMKQITPVSPAPTSSTIYRGFLKEDGREPYWVIVPTAALYMPLSRAGQSADTPILAAAAGGSGSQPAPAPEENLSSGLSTAGIVGIVVGSVLAVAALAGLVWLRTASLRRSRQQPQPDKPALLPGHAKQSPTGVAHSAGSCDGTPSSSAGAPGMLPSASAPGMLPELAQRVAEEDAAGAAAAAKRRSSPQQSDHILVSMESLPHLLLDWVVLPSQISFLTWPSGARMQIGAGASARVYKARFNGETVACKEVDIGASAKNQEAFLAEAGHLVRLRHPNIVSLFGVSVEGTKGLVLLEYCEGRDLYHALDVPAAGRQQQRLFSWHRRGRKVALDVAKALNYLHSKDIVHLDIKSPNVLLTGDGTAKLADVGFSREKLNTFLTDAGAVVGTWAWIAPELLLGTHQCTFAVDVYSTGVLLWELITGERPKRGQLRPPRVPEECPQEAADLMYDCLRENPSERPTAPQLLQRLTDMADWLELSKRSTPVPPPTGDATVDAAASAASAAGSAADVVPPLPPRPAVVRVSMPASAHASPFAAMATPFGQPPAGPPRRIPSGGSSRSGDGSSSQLGGDSLPRPALVGFERRLSELERKRSSALAAAVEGLPLPSASES